MSGHRGCTEPSLDIYLNIDDPLTVQKYTLAHELIEVLYFAITDDTANDYASWLDDNLFSSLMDRKEAFCEMGAADIVMPLEPFTEVVERQPITLDVATGIASMCQVSLTACLRRIVESGLAFKVFIIWQHKNKPTDRLPSKMGLANLFGSPEFMDAPKMMRVARAFTPPDFGGRVFEFESVSEVSLIQRAFDSGITAVGYEYIDLENLQGSFYVEAMPVHIDGERRVMSLIHVDRPDPKPVPRNIGWGTRLPHRR